MVMIRTALFSVLVSSLLAVSASGAAISPTDPCKHKIVMDFTSCPRQTLSSYYPEFYDAETSNYLAQANDLKSICITPSNVKGLFFQKQGRANIYGTNVYGVSIDFGSSQTTASFYVQDAFGFKQLDQSPARYATLQITNPEYTQGTKVVNFNAQSSEVVTLSQPHAYVHVKFCSA